MRTVPRHSICVGYGHLWPYCQYLQHSRKGGPLPILCHCSSFPACERCELTLMPCPVHPQMVLYQLFTFRTRYIYGRLWFSYTVWNKVAFLWAISCPPSVVAAASMPQPGLAIQVLVHWGWNLREKMEEQTWATLLPVIKPAFRRPAA